ncbi:DUF1707 domain-containing protein [Streptomyces monashensis]|uniref:DUF1707 SHOCT-like domain-containing protein n=1 Tax=Streptomyces monashensis TaxID=1678012 RepID=UPI00340B3DEE
MTADMVDADVPDGLRASHADRDRVVDALAAAAGEGRLTHEELDERVTAALAARTLGQLAVLTADLPVEAGAAAAPAPAKDVVRIEQQYASATRDGRWIVPRRLEIECAWGNVTLDFSDAVLTHDTLDIDLGLCGGTLRLITRPGMVVDTDALALYHSKAKVRPARGSEAPVVLRVGIGGQISMGKVDVRPPRRWLGK